MKTGIIIVIVIGILVIGGYFLYSVLNGGPGTNLNNRGNAGGSTSKSVEISGFAFNPGTLTINVGEQVTWTNKDSASHTVTSDSGSELASSTFGNGKTYSYTFNTAGTYNYHCSIHTSMKGTIIVQ
jgi:plastocyanin